MNKNNNENKNNKKGIMYYLSKDFKGEGIIILILGVFLIVVSILMFLNVIEMSSSESEDKNQLLKIITALAGVILLIYGIVDFKTKRKIFDKSVYYKFLNDYNSNNIINKLVTMNLDETNIGVFNENDNITLRYLKKEGSFLCYIYKTEVIMSFEYIDEIYEKYDQTEDESLIPLDELLLELDALKVSQEEVYNKFVKMILENEHLTK